MECQSKTDGDGAGTALRNASINEDTKLSTILKPRHRHEPLSSVNSSILPQTLGHNAGDARIPHSNWD